MVFDPLYYHVLRGSISPFSFFQPPKSFCVTLMVIILVKKTTSSILRVNVTSQSDFPVKVKGHTEIGRKMDTDTDKQYFH